MTLERRTLLSLLFFIISCVQTFVHQMIVHGSEGFNLAESGTSAGLKIQRFWVKVLF